MHHNNNRRRNFRSRPQKNNFRRRSINSSHNTNGHFSTNSGNRSFNRNGQMSNPVNIEKTINKFQQLAKDAQSSGDPVLVENYLQHADHYSRRLAEINNKNSQNSSDKPNFEEKNKNLEIENKDNNLTDKT